MKFRDTASFGIMLLLLLHPGSVLAQLDNGLPVSSQAPRKNEPEGIERDGYRIQQSVELGYRVTDLSGSAPMYDTLVNLETGPHSGAIAVRAIIDSRWPIRQRNS